MIFLLMVIPIEVEKRFLDLCEKPLRFPKDSLLYWDGDGFVKWRKTAEY